MTRTRTRIVWVGALALLALALWLVFGRGDGVPVDAVEVDRGPLEVTVNEDGMTRARDRYTVAAPVTGRLSRATVSEGDHVDAGAVLTTIAPAPVDPGLATQLRAEVEAAQARQVETEQAVADARTRYDQAAREFARREPLFEMGAISREVFEQFEAAEQAASAALERARATQTAAAASVAAARARLLGTEGNGGAALGVEAPVAGIVLRVVEENERVVTAGTPILEIGGPEGLEVVADILTRDAVAVRPGQSVRVTGWGGDEVLEGSVRRVEPAAFTRVSALGVDEQRVNVVIDLASIPDGLGAGYRTDVSIVTWSESAVLRVPTSAVFSANGGWAVFRVEEGRAAMRRVEIGRRSSEAVEIQSGLEEGDRVVVFPPGEVSDGTRVSVRDP